MFWKIVILIIGVGVVAWQVWSRVDASRARERLQQAAVCNGEIDPQQLEDSAEAAVRQSHISLAEARRDVEQLACPGMNGPTN